MKDPRDIIIAPIVSEKSYELIESGVYTFQVHTSASKPEIRDAVESIWGGEVSKVNTLNRAGSEQLLERYLIYGSASLFVNLPQACRQLSDR